MTDGNETSTIVVRCCRECATMETGFHEDWCKTWEDRPNNLVLAGDCYEATYVAVDALLSDEAVKAAYDVMAGHPCFNYTDGLHGLQRALRAAVDALQGRDGS